MFTPASHYPFSLNIHGETNELMVLCFSGKEAISTPYAFEVEIVSEQHELDLEGLLRQPAFLAFGNSGNGIHGLIQRVKQHSPGLRISRYSLTLVPQLAYLELRTNQRIFQNLSVPDVIGQILEEHGILSDAYAFNLGARYPERTYCVQYRESDLQFVQRLCQEEGIHYHFQHDTDAHRLVFGDDQTVFPKLAPVAHQQDSGMVASAPVIKRFELSLETRTSRTTRRDHDFEQPHLTLESAHDSDAVPNLEDYSCPGFFKDRGRGKQLARRALERHRSDWQLANGRSDQPSLRSGHFLPMTHHPKARWNDLWLLTEVSHEGKQPQVLEEFTPSDAAPSQDGFHQGYRNHFKATPWQVPFRPPLTPPKPRIFGSQSAVVTGPVGEEIHCDHYGRVKAQFHWDREGQADAGSSCWIRVCSIWAGARYGAISLPRVGMEVLVSFLEGDPDQPLITGCLFHKENPAPYELPINNTLSTFKTLSSPGGGGFNELRVEDRQGQEQIFVHAQRNWDQHIRHDQRIRVGNERHHTVEQNSYSELKGEEHHTLCADRKVLVHAHDHLRVGANQYIRVGKGQSMQAGREIHLSSGIKVVLGAGSELTLKAGSSFIKIARQGITLEGPLVRMNSGGSAGIGTPASPLPPGPLQQMAPDAAGRLLIPALRQALMQKKPICAVCATAKGAQSHG